MPATATTHATMDSLTITARDIARDGVAAFSRTCPAARSFGICDVPRERDPHCGGWTGCADGCVRNGFVATAADLAA